MRSDPRTVSAGAGSPGSAIARAGSGEPRRFPLTDLDLGTIDEDGRVVLRSPAAILGWQRGDEVRLSVRDGVVRIAGTGGLGPAQAVAHPVRLDDRFRVRVPYGIRTLVRLRPATRVMIATSVGGRVVAVLPLALVLEAFGEVG